MQVDAKAVELVSRVPQRVGGYGKPMLPKSVAHLDHVHGSVASPNRGTPTIAGPQQANIRGEGRWVTGLSPVRLAIAFGRLRIVGRVGVVLRHPLDQFATHKGLQVSLKRVRFRCGVIPSPAD